MCEISILEKIDILCVILDIWYGMWNVWYMMLDVRSGIWHILYSVYGILCLRWDTWYGVWDNLSNSTDEMSCVPGGISALLYWMSCVTCEISDVMFVCLVYLNKSDVLFTSLGCLVWYVRYLMYRLRYLLCSVGCRICQLRYLI